MGEWQNSAWVKSSDTTAIQAALVDIFGSEKRSLVAKPPARKPARQDRMQYGKAADSRLWAVAMIPGAAGWTLLKTAPFELLCEKAPKAKGPRLGALAKALGCDAFQVNLYDGDSLVLVEATARGVTKQSGVNFQEIDDPEALDEDTFQPRFSLVDVPAQLKKAVSGDVVRATRTIATALGGSNAESADNVLQVNVLIPHKDLRVSGARALYFKG